jgi:hypothetical protein
MSDILSDDERAAAILKVYDDIDAESAKNNKHINGVDDVESIYNLDVHSLHHVPVDKMSYTLMSFAKKFMNAGYKKEALDASDLAKAMRRISKELAQKKSNIVSL